MRAEAKVDPGRLIGELLDMESTKNPEFIGKPYAMARFSAKGTKWFQGEDMCGNVLK
jgi:hypothetical protein